METSKVYITDMTVVPAYPLLLFGGDIEVDHENAILSVDKWSVGFVSGYPRLHIN